MRALILLLLLNLCIAAAGQESSIKSQLNLVDSLVDQEEFEQVRPILERLSTSSDIPPSSLDADRLSAIWGYYYFNQDKYDSALYYFRPILFKSWISEDNEFLSYIGKAINDAGIVYYRVGKVDSAELAHDRSLDLAIEHNDLQLQAYNYNNLAILYKNQKKYVQAMQYFDKSLEINKAIPDLEGQGFQYLNMAMLLHDQSNHIESLANYLKALEIFEELEKDNLKLVVYDRMGRYYIRINDLQSASNYYNQAYELAKSTNDRRYIGRSLQNLGRVEAELNNPEKALIYLNQALEVFVSMNLSRSVFDTHNEIGKAFKDLKNYPKALEHYDMTLDIVGDRSPSSRIAIEIGKAHVYNLMGSPNQAKALALESLNRYPLDKQTNKSLMSLYGVISNSE